MFVNVAVLKETQAHERRVALVPAVAPKLTRLGARLHLQSGAGDAVDIPDSAYTGIVFVKDRKALVADADIVLCVQPPALEVIEEMKQGAILLSFIYAEREPQLVHAMLERKITCFAMERILRISRAQNTKPGDTVRVGNVTIVAPLNVPSLLGDDASSLYSHNQYSQARSGRGLEPPRGSTRPRTDWRVHEYI